MYYFHKHNVEKLLGIGFKPLQKMTISPLEAFIEDVCARAQEKLLKQQLTFNYQ